MSDPDITRTEKAVVRKCAFNEYFSIYKLTKQTYML